jgi:hypothetical protein
MVALIHNIARDFLHYNNIWLSLKNVYLYYKKINWLQLVDNTATVFLYCNNINFRGNNVYYCHIF